MSRTTILVIGAVLLLVIIYMLFEDYFTGKTTVKKQSHLLHNAPERIISTDLSVPDATNYTYSIWVYVNSWVTNENNIIFRRNHDIELSLEPNTSTLVCKTGQSLSETIQITNNFPLQKWVCVLISVDNVIMDAYLDGKLVKSVQMNISWNQSQHSTQNIEFASGSDIYISQFERKPSPTDPKGAYDKYLEGADTGSMLSALGNFNINLSILKDNIETSKYSLI
jgi:hypothetical protein